MRTRVFSPNTPVARSIPDTEVVLTPAPLSRLTDLERNVQSRLASLRVPQLFGHRPQHTRCIVKQTDRTPGPPDTQLTGSGKPSMVRL